MSPLEIVDLRKKVAVCLFVQKKALRPVPCRDTNTVSNTDAYNIFGIRLPNSLLPTLAVAVYKSPDANKTDMELIFNDPTSLKRQKSLETVVLIVGDLTFLLFMAKKYA